jgi:sporulation protein YlmC with PRC-barrel domain
MKTILTTASVIALMAGSAFAQDTTMEKPAKTPAAQNEMAPVKTAAYTGEMSVNDLINKSVKNANNETVGDINDIRVGSNGKIAAVIIGVGGFLGLGEKDVALPYDQLSFTRDGDGGLVVTANVTKDSLQSAPQWKKPEDRS